MIKKILAVFIMYIACDTVAAQKDNNSVGLEGYSSAKASSSGGGAIVITPTYWLEGDYSILLDYDNNRRSLGVGLTTGGLSREVDIIPRTEKWEGYGDLAKIKSALGFSFLWQRRFFFNHEINQGWYFSILLRFRKYKFNIHEFDNVQFDDPVSDKLKWLNIMYNVGYTKHFSQNFFVDAYAGVGYRFEFVKFHQVFSSYDYYTGKTSYTLSEYDETFVRILPTLGVRLGYIFN